MMTGMKTAGGALIAAVGVLAVAAPARAASPVVASQKYQWYYWAAPILAITVVFAVIGLSGGYIMKVLFPKYRGRKVKE